MRNLLKATAAVAVVVALTMALIVRGSSPNHDIAEAATGDNLRQFDAAVPPCASGIGTGLAFDGAELLLSCWSSNVIERVSPADGSSLGTYTVAGVTDLGAIAWDASRGKLWACQGGSSVYLIDLVTATGTSQFGSGGCVDGLAYDGVDDTIWTSADVSDTLNHYQSDGTFIGAFSGITAKLGGYGSSGIAVGGTNLYLANNGGSQIYECSKDLATCTLMSTFARRLEDLECDNVTFAPKAAIWSNDAYDRTLNAWEIPAGLCGVGGQPDDPTPTPTSTEVAATDTPTPTTTATEVPPTDTPVPTSTPTSGAVTTTVTPATTRTAVVTRTVQATRTVAPTKTAVRTATATATPNHVRCADVTGDGRVNLHDLAAVFWHIGKPYNARYDLNWDGRINLVDLSIVVKQLRRRC